MKTQQSGFTLIELIMVIVILGILSAFALPRFADLSGDAERATVEGVLGAAKSASAISHSAYLAAGSNPATITLEGNVSVAITNGYPDSDDICEAAGADTDFNCDTSTTTGSAIISTNGAVDDHCFTYTEAASSSAVPTFSVMGTIQAGGTCG